MSTRLVRGCFATVTCSLASGCGCLELFAGLADFQRDLLIAALFMAAWVEQRARIEAEESVRTIAVVQNGRDCWDINGNSLDDPNEDRNEDGIFDAQDCIGPRGDAGPAGPSGVAGARGLHGLDGRHCWDLNNNGVGDPREDRNQDGLWNSHDCQGLAGPSGATGPTGSAGPDGVLYFHVIVDDFFTVSDSNLGTLPILRASIEEPMLGSESTGSADRAVAFRIVIPHGYRPGDDVVMRIYLYRIGQSEGPCFVFSLDARRLRHGLNVQPYDHATELPLETCDLLPWTVGCGRRWVRVDSNLYAEPQANRAPNNDGELSVLELPINTLAGLDFPNDLGAADVLAFQLQTHVADGAGYQLLGVEFFESEPAAAQLVGATVFPTLQSLIDDPWLCDPAASP